MTNLRPQLKQGLGWRGGIMVCALTPDRAFPARAPDRV